MSLAPVFNAIKAQLLANVANVTPFNQAVTAQNTLAYVQMWNNQLASWRDSFKKVGDDELVTGSNNTYIPQMPAILIEFANINPIELGAGVQLFDELIVRVHIVHEKLDAGDGTMEQNLEVFALVDQVYKVLNKFRPAGCIEFIRQNPQEPDYNHNGLYHYIETFVTNYVDNSQLEPVGGVPANITKLEIDIMPEKGVLVNENDVPIVNENNDEIIA